ncbi:uncharacterized protein LOC131953714 isoform X2 [Physella acuta]|uniref:uncharacterized protein LOC131953714 isoform X2 n=1 Tax=Physella acuta TaxID=109671 RepID=UPI0027DD19B5|nr:uncharacterized protein LOC131953714 isoform X2 [Physella acuta]
MQERLQKFRQSWENLSMEGKMYYSKECKKLKKTQETLNVNRQIPSSSKDSTLIQVKTQLPDEMVQKVSVPKREVEDPSLFATLSSKKQAKQQKNNGTSSGLLDQHTSKKKTKKRKRHKEPTVKQMKERLVLLEKILPEKEAKLKELEDLCQKLSQEKEAFAEIIDDLAQAKKETYSTYCTACFQKCIGSKPLKSKYFCEPQE